MLVRLQWAMVVLMMVLLRCLLYMMLSLLLKTLLQESEAFPSPNARADGNNVISVGQTKADGD